MVTKNELLSFVQTAKKETYSTRKQVVIKPSVAKKLDMILKKQEISFNGLVNRFLEAYVEAEQNKRTGE